MGIKAILRRLRAHAGSDPRIEGFALEIHSGKLAYRDALFLLKNPPGVSRRVAQPVYDPPLPGGPRPLVASIGAVLRACKERSMFAGPHKPGIKADGNRCANPDCVRCACYSHRHRIRAAALPQGERKRRTRRTRQEIMADKAREKAQFVAAQETAAILADRERMRPAAKAGRQFYRNGEDY